VALCRAGFSLTELLAALTLGGLIAVLLLGTLTAQVRLSRHVADRAAENEAVRIAAAVLDGEIRRSAPADLRVVSRDSIALRAIRGIGLPCHTDARVFRYRGDRLPDPRKDSALFVLPDTVAVLPVTDARGATSAACQAAVGETLIDLRSGSAGPEMARHPVAVLVFESGRYYLTARALRYRLGAEGRQPLTSEAFRHPDARFRERAPHSLQFDLTTERRSIPRAVSFGPPPQ
jgi:prepilin-type N-terminal cleavage/methylation domain-containing protein